MGINLRKIFPKEFEALEKRDIHCDNINTDILEYMLLDHLGLLSEFKETPLHFISSGYCRTQRLLTIVPPDYHSDPKTTVPILNVAYNDEQRAKINLLLQSIENKYPTGNLVEINRCDAGNEYCPYANYPTELLQKALQRNALMDATDEQHVQSLTKEEFDALKNRVQAFIFPDKKQDVELIAQINRIMQKMDEMYVNKASHKQNSSVMFQRKQPEKESAAVTRCYDETFSNMDELTRLRKLVKEQESTIASLRQDLNNHRQSELNALRSANAARNDADRFERTKNKMTRYGRNF